MVSNHGQNYKNDFSTNLNKVVFLCLEEAPTSRRGSKHKNTKKLAASTEKSMPRVESLNTLVGVSNFTVARERRVANLNRIGGVVNRNSVEIVATYESVVANGRNTGGDDAY